LQQISEDHAAYAPLQYVLLFPYGNNGWHSALTLYRPHCSATKRLSLTRYTSFRIHSRPTEYSTILRGGRLFQRYVVDMWAAVEQQRLDYLRLNQSKLLASLYSGLEDAFHDEDHRDLNDIGQRVVLPSSFINGPRHQQQKFQDSMTIARHYRDVDLFITMTANPQ
jgi:hypothetical protein